MAGQIPYRQDVEDPDYKQDPTHSLLTFSHNQALPQSRTPLFLRLLTSCRQFFGVVTPVISA